MVAKATTGRASRPGGVGRREVRPTVATSQPRAEALAWPKSQSHDGIACTAATTTSPAAVTAGARLCARGERLVECGGEAGEVSRASVAEIWSTIQPKSLTTVRGLLRKAKW